jgi:hypothetical protein
MDESTLVSNADRERVVARLSDAHVDGRLTVEELDRLTGAAHTARTVGELGLVVANLPGPPVAGPDPGALTAGARPYTGGQIAGMTALTIFVPAGRLIGLVVALSLMRDEHLPERRRLLRTWALASAAVLALEIVAILLFVVHL